MANNNILGKIDDDDDDDKNNDLNDGNSTSYSSSEDSDAELLKQRIDDNDPRWRKVTYDGGVKKIVLSTGWGKPAPDGSDAYIRYIGKFQDTQRVFDDNTSLNPPFKFLVGHFRVIRAIDIAVAAMQIGEKCMLRTTSRYAYGEKGEGRKIAPNKDLDYELEVIDWTDWKRVNNKDEIRKRILQQGEGDMYDVPDNSAICDITYTAQVFDDCKYSDNVFSCGRHISFMVNEDPTFPDGFHDCLKTMNKYEIAEFKIESIYAFGKDGIAELGIKPNQTIYYRIHMHNYQNLMSRWKMEPEQLFDVAKRFKDKAQQYYELGNYDYAFQRYEKSLEYWEADEKYNLKEKEIAKDACNLIHNNLAMIHLKKKEYKDCIRECKKVLKRDPKNIKAITRKGQSKMMLAEYNDAYKDLKLALSYDSTNKYIKRLLKINKNKKKNYIGNQKKLYGGMFDKYNAVQKEKAKNKKIQKDIIMKQLQLQSKQQQQQQQPNYDVKNSDDDNDDNDNKNIKNLNDVDIRIGDIDDYDRDNDDNDSEMSINFSDFDDIDDDDDDDNDNNDNNNNNNNNDINKPIKNALSDIDESD